MRSQSLGPKSGVLIWILAASAASCGALARDSGSDGTRRGESLELERLQIGSIYGIGSGFSSDGLEFVVEPFGTALGNAEISTTGADEKDPVKTLRLAHATLRCSGERADGLEFEYVDNGGPIGIEVGGQERSAEDFIALDGTKLGLLAIAVSESSTGGVRRGRVSILGKLDGFAISGSDLEILDLRLAR